MLEVGKTYKDNNHWDVKITGEHNGKFIGLLPSCNQHRFYNADGTPENYKDPFIVFDTTKSTDVIDLTKQYQTQSGLQVKLFCIMENRVFGAVLSEDGEWTPHKWNVYWVITGYELRSSQPSFNLVPALCGGGGTLLLCDVGGGTTIRKPKPNYSDFEIDDPVIVWNNDDANKRYRRHFAGVNGLGNPMAFDGGYTSFTRTGSGITIWDNCIINKQ